MKLSPCYNDAHWFIKNINCFRLMYVHLSVAFQLISVEWKNVCYSWRAIRMLPFMRGSLTHNALNQKANSIRFEMVWKFMIWRIICMLEMKIHWMQRMQHNNSINDHMIKCALSIGFSLFTCTCKNESFSRCLSIIKIALKFIICYFNPFYIYIYDRWWLKREQNNTSNSHMIHQTYIGVIFSWWAQVCVHGTACICPHSDLW